jgi:hypothetical protein
LNIGEGVNVTPAFKINRLEAGLCDLIYMKDFKRIFYDVEDVEGFNFFRRKMTRV